MPENQNAIGEHWTKESVAILKQFGWVQKGTTNFDIECVHHIKERRGQPHGVDSFFEYYDPYCQSTQAILVESKNWQFESITTANIKKWIKQITDCIECMQVSTTVQQLTSSPIQNAILMCWAHDQYDYAAFKQQFDKVGIASKKYPCNVFVASNNEILKWCSLISTINMVKASCESFKYIYPNVPTLGTNLVLTENLTLTHLFSKYIFAEVTYKVINVTGGHDFYKKLVVYSFDSVSVQSLLFLNDLVKRLNFQSYPICELYLYEKEMNVRHIVAEFLGRTNQQIRGDINKPSTIEVKYLDIYNGMTNIPDTIIRFREA